MLLHIVSQLETVCILSMSLFLSLLSRLADRSDGSDEFTIKAGLSLVVEDITSIENPGYVYCNPGYVYCNRAISAANHHAYSVTMVNSHPNVKLIDLFFYYQDILAILIHRQ